MRYGAKYENDKLCKNSTVATTTNFICDADAKFNTSNKDITQYLSSIQRIPEAECFVSYLFSLFTRYTPILANEELKNGSYV